MTSVLQRKLLCRRSCFSEIIRINCLNINADVSFSVIKFTLEHDNHLYAACDKEIHGDNSSSVL